MRRRDNGQKPTHIRERRFDSRGSGAELALQPSLPRNGLGLRVIQQTTPDSGRVLEFLPISAWIEGFIGIIALASGMLRPATPFERKWLHDFNAVAPAEAK